MNESPPDGHKGNGVPSPRAVGEQTASTDEATCHKEQVVNRSGQALKWIVENELWIALGVVLLLILPNRVSAVALCAVPCLWILRWIQRGSLTRRTALDQAILVILVMIPVTLYATAVPSLTWVASYQIVAGVALFYALVNSLRVSRHAELASQLMVLSGGGLSIAALLSTRWTTDKVFSLPQLYGGLPLLLPETIHPNVLAGTLAMLIPFAGALALYRHDQSCTPATRCLCRVLPLLGLATMTPVLVLTQSRGAYIAVTVALLVIALVRFRWLLASVPLIVAALLVMLEKIGRQRMMDLVLTTSALGSMEGRQELWSRAVYMIQDFPYTGIGMGTFSRVSPVMYPYFILGPDAHVPHAHNLFLQVGADLGIPGLVAFVALLSGSLVMAWKSFSAFRKRHDYILAGVSLGLFAGLISMFIHGMTDAVTWGTKPSVVSWAFMALAAVTYRLAVDLPSVEKQ